MTSATSGSRCTRPPCPTSPPRLQGVARNRHPNMALRRVVDLAKLRWRVEHDYEDLKQEIGLGHYEGRGWPDSIITARCTSQPTVS
jgi:hypothetical protein